MKKGVLLLTMMVVCVVLLFAVSADEIAEAAITLGVPYSELKALVDTYAPVSPEARSPVGTFAPGPTMFNLIIDEIMKEERLIPGSPEYVKMRSFYAQLFSSYDLLDLIGLKEDMYLVFTLKNIYFEDEMVEYYLDRDTRTVWVDVEGTALPFGTFDKHYSVFTMEGEPLAVFDRQM